MKTKVVRACEATDILAIDMSDGDDGTIVAWPQAPRHVGAPVQRTRKGLIEIGKSGEWTDSLDHIRVRLVEDGDRIEFLDD